MEPGPGFEPQISMASDLEIRGSNPGPGSNFSLENLICNMSLLNIIINLFYDKSTHQKIRRRKEKPKWKHCM